MPYGQPSAFTIQGGVEGKLNRYPDLNQRR
jgi:hypothetical protein